MGLLDIACIGFTVNPVVDAFREYVRNGSDLGDWATLAPVHVLVDDRGTHDDDTNTLKLRILTMIDFTTAVGKAGRSLQVELAGLGEDAVANVVQSSALYHIVNGIVNDLFNDLTAIEGNKTGDKYIPANQAATFRKEGIEIKDASDLCEVLHYIVILYILHT